MHPDRIQVSYQVLTEAYQALGIHQAAAMSISRGQKRYPNRHSCRNHCNIIIKRLHHHAIDDNRGAVTHPADKIGASLMKLRLRSHLMDDSLLGVPTLDVPPPPTPHSRTATSIAPSLPAHRMLEHPLHHATRLTLDQCHLSIC